MAKRILMVLTPQTTGDLRSTARSAAVVARDSGGQIRMVFVRPIPPPRMDHHDRLVADPDMEMVRLAGLAESWMAALELEFGDVPVESRVRFGRLTGELRIGWPRRPGPRCITGSAPGIWARCYRRRWSCCRRFRMTRPIGAASRWSCPPPVKLAR